MKILLLLLLLVGCAGVQRVPAADLADWCADGGAPCEAEAYLAAAERMRQARTWLSPAWEWCLDDGFEPEECASMDARGELEDAFETDGMSLFGAPAE